MPGLKLRPSSLENAELTNILKTQGVNAYALLKSLISVCAVAAAMSTASADSFILDWEDPAGFQKDIDAFRSSMKVFRSRDGNGVIIRAEKKAKKKELLNNYFFGDGKSFHQIAKSRPKSGHPLAPPAFEFFSDVSENQGGAALLPKDDAIEVKCGAKTLDFTGVAAAVAKRITDSAQFVPVPDVRKLFGLYRVDQSGSLLYIDFKKYEKYDPRAYWGTPGNMKKAKIHQLMTACTYIENYKVRPGQCVEFGIDEDIFQIYVVQGAPADIAEQSKCLHLEHATPGLKDVATWGSKKLECMDVSSFDWKSLGIPGIPAEQVKLKTPCDP